MEVTAPRSELMNGGLRVGTRQFALHFMFSAFT